MTRRIPFLRNFFLLGLLALGGSCQFDAPASEGEVFRYNEPTAIGSLDPAFASDQAHGWLSKQLFSTLVDSDSTLSPVPQLAHRWEASLDGMEWTFYLRTDVYFHDDPCFPGGQGRRMTAADVAYSLERLMATETSSPGWWILAQVGRIEVLDSATIRFHLTQPEEAMLGRLAMPYCGIVAPEAVAMYGADFSSHPVGTGPFYLKAWARQEKIVLRRNTRYFGRDAAGQPLPYLEAVAVRCIPDRQAAFLEFVKGELDMVSGMDASYKDQLFTQEGTLQSRWEGRLSLQKAPFLNTEFLGIRQKNPSPAYLGDVRVREALNWAIDRASMMRYLKNNVGIPAHGGVLPAGMPGYREADAWEAAGTPGWSFDPGRAKALLHEAGLLDADGRPKPDLEPIVVSTTASYRDICEYIQSAWNQLGLPVEVQVMPSAAFREDKANGRLPVYRASWIADYPSAGNYFMLFDSKWAAPLGANASQIESPELDAGIAQWAMAERTGQGAEAAFALDQKIHRSALCIPLFYDESIRVFHHEWVGIPPHPMNMLDLRRARRR
ncbi:MAG: ABC transporter substrate-binding protein [Flavobacteriia bacterium]|nr:ABC transporter substrate-binding protein [Flavobacteriia bacterium]